MSRQVIDPSGNPLPAIFMGTSQNRSIEATSQQSAPFGSATRIIRVVSDVDCRVAIGQNPAADGNSTLLKAGVPEYWGCQGNDRIAVLQESSGGSLNITEGGQQ
jgi:hypothetical protein